MEWGARFDREPDGQPSLAIEGAHSARRVLHARDATGREIGNVLWTRVSRLPGVTAHSHARVVELIVHGGRCVGARYLNDDGSLEAAYAGTVLLATGGAGQVYSETTNPPVATGDGVSMAFRAGADVADLEFVQFHPTALKVDGQPRFLLSEALRGEGARLVNADGEAFVSSYEPQGDLASRDRVSRAIAREVIRTSRPVYLSLEHLDPDYVHERFPLISDACRRAGLDLARDPVPIGPAAHYVMGGVRTDLHGLTSIPGLYAAGEVACTGVHGANRLASNSLLEGLVFGARAGRAMKRESAAAIDVPVTVPEGGPGRLTIAADDIRSLMWRDVGLFRERAALARAVSVLDAAWQEASAPRRERTALDYAGWRTLSLLTVGRLIARAALRREESRGAHYRSDYPERDDIHWNHRVSDSRADGR
jgi:L-aspartate oxidase